MHWLTPVLLVALLALSVSLVGLVLSLMSTATAANERIAKLSSENVEMLKRQTALEQSLLHAQEQNRELLRIAKQETDSLKAETARLSAAAKSVAANQAAQRKRIEALERARAAARNAVAEPF